MQQALIRYRTEPDQAAANEELLPGANRMGCRQASCGLAAPRFFR
jgi:hypothetical protein